MKETTERGTTGFTLQSNLIVVDVVVNGVGGQFLLDTGAAGTVLTKEFAERLKLEEVDRSAGAGAGGTVRMSIVRVDSITVAGITDRAIACPVMDIADVRAHVGSNIDGILGFDFFGSGTLHVDYPARRVTLERPARRGSAEPFVVTGGVVRLNEFGLEVPVASKGWTTTTDTPLPTIPAIFKGPAGAEIAVSIMSINGLGVASMKASLDASVAAQVEDFERFGSADVQRAGRPGYRIEYVGTHKGKRLRFATEAILFENGLVVLTCEAPVEAFAQVAADFELVLSSLRAYEGRVNAK
ncbi:MAG: hypothetical protein FLDDKLPJ_01329 [Phycisphaerae bacterium]|nr:hypothetical protein [Phycisphaerae bacterium]